MAQDFKTIYQWSYTSNSILNISLMYNTSPEVKYNKYFVFLSIIPGEKNNNGRTFNMSNGINFKIQPARLSEFGHALMAYARKQQHLVGKFSIFVDSSKAASGGSNQSKSLLMNYMDNSNDNKDNAITITGKVNQGNSSSIVLSIPGAITVATVCEKIFEHYLELDMANYSHFEGKKNYADNTVKNNYNNNTNNFNQTQSMQGSESSNFVDEVPW